MALTCSDVGELPVFVALLSGLLRLFGELIGYLDVSKLAIISEHRSSCSMHQYLKKIVECENRNTEKRHGPISYLKADVTKGSPRFFVSLLISKRINSVVGVSYFKSINIEVSASA